MSDLEGARQEALEQARQLFEQQRRTATPIFENLLINPDPETKIWRYMSRWKYESLLATHSLYFSQTKRFQDEHEGSTSPLVPDGSLHRDSLLDQVCESLRENTAVSCWSMGNPESAALWELFLSNEQEGVAVQTTVARLLNSLERQPKYAYQVHYADENAHEFDWNHPGSAVTGEIWQLLFIKRCKLAPEREYRIVVEAFDMTDDHPHVLVPVNLHTLIEAVCIAPRARSEFAEHIQELTLQQSGLGVPVRKVSA